MLRFDLGRAGSAEYTQGTQPEKIGQVGEAKLSDKTELTAVEKRGTWTVRIAWPNGSIHYFGKFASKEEAAGWIKEHYWMTAKKIEDRDLLRRGGRRSVGSGVGEK